jgi:hypothetical protein
LIINFSQLVSQVQFGTFHITPPPNFHNENTQGSRSNQRKERQAATSEETMMENAKKKKTKETRDRIKNETPHPEICMLPSKMWAVNFSSKNINIMPKWNNKCRACPRWFLQKYCFSICKHKESDIKANNIPAKNLSSMKAWI